MAIRTQQSVSGFIASDPQLTRTENGDARFYARFGQENYRREEDGSFTKLDTTFNHLVMYRKTAQRAFERFAKGDKFVAEGYQHEYTVERGGETIQDVEFVAKKIGHDTARTRYEVDRTPRSAPERGQGKVFDAPVPRNGTDAGGMGLWPWTSTWASMTFPSRVTSPSPRPGRLTRSTGTCSRLTIWSRSCLN